MALAANTRENIPSTLKLTTMPTTIKRTIRARALEREEETITTPNDPC